MEVIVAPNKMNVYSGYMLDVFLAGGITNCRDWQSEVIEYLKQYEVNNELDLRVYNPRRPNFNIKTDDSEEQIRWEYSNIESTEIFSMYFCNSESDQPICMYELGMRLGRIVENPHSFLSLLNGSYNTIISVEDGYKRANDVVNQTRLACADTIKVHLHATPESHAKLIIDEYNSIKNKVKYNIRIKNLYKNVRNWIMENAKQDSNMEKPAYIEPAQLEDLYKYLKDNLINVNKDIYPCLKCDPNTRLACCGCPEYFEFQAKHVKEKKSE